jgi:MFS family permease
VRARLPDLGALQEPAFRRLWLARTTSSIGDALIPVALPFAVLGIGAGASGLGLVLAAFTLGRVAFVVAGGVWSDRLPRRLVMLACDVVRGGVDAFVAVALVAGFMELWMFVVTAGLFGGAGAFFGPASTGLVPQTVSQGRLQQANALLSLSQSASSIFGPAVSGAIVALGSPAWVFAIDSASFVASALFLVGLRVAPLARPVAQRFFADVRDGLGEVRSRRWLAWGFVAFAITNLGIAPFWVLGPIVARSDLGGPSAWGAILTGGAVGGVLGGIAVYRVRPRRPLVACWSMWMLCCLPSLALAVPMPTPAIVAASGAFSFGIVFSNALWVTVLQREVPANRLSRVDALDWMVSLVFMPIGQVAAGPLAGTIGVQGPLLLAAALIVLPDAVMLAMRDVRELRSPEPPPVPQPEEPATAALPG